MNVLQKVWRGLHMVLHLLLGVGQLFRAGGHREPFHPRVRSTVQGWYGRLLRILDVDVEVIGELPHEREGAVIMIANHISWVDIPLIGALTPVNFLSKAEVKDWPLVGPLAARIGTLFIYRGSGDTDHVMEAMAGHLNRNLSVLFFPEGTTTDGSKVRRFHKKLFKVCEAMPVRVCPLFIHYSAEGDVNPLPFVGDVGFGSHLWQLLGHRRLKATVEVLPAVDLDPELVGHQIRGIELAMREKLAVRQGV
jgi:1-acyl-sn-glycerol-3-phosphate acyltransferase